MLHIGASELRRAYYAHKQVAAGGNSMSHYLLRFYSVECGLKHVWMRECRFWTSKQCKTEMEAFGHRLDKLVKELKLPAYIGSPPQVKLSRGETVPTHLVHEGWRYGATMDSDSERSMASWLLKVDRWIERVL